MYCKCEGGSHNSVYAWRDGISVLICSQCQLIDEHLTNHYLEMRTAYKNNKKVQDIKGPESEPTEDKLISDHFWMLFVDPVVKELDDDNDFKEIILDKCNKIHNKHIKKHPFNIELYFKKRLIRMYNKLTKKPIKDILKKLRSKFKTYREAYTTTISLFTKWNMRIMQ